MSIRNIPYKEAGKKWVDATKKNEKWFHAHIIGPLLYISIFWTQFGLQQRTSISENRFRYNDVEKQCDIYL